MARFKGEVNDVINKWHAPLFYIGYLRPTDCHYFFNTSMMAKNVNPRFLKGYVILYIKDAPYIQKITASYAHPWSESSLASFIMF
jgi:hypothetical protein